MTSTTRRDSQPDPVQQLTEQVIMCGGTFTTIIHHMADAAASGRCDPDAPPITEVLHTLVHDTIDPLRIRFSPGELRSAARVLTAVVDEIGENIFFVDMEALGDGEDGFGGDEPPVG